MIPDLLISGGQTGADRGGLEAAQKLGIPTGGFAPKGYRTEDGPDLTLRDVFGLEEHESLYDYAPRTEANVKMADATVIFGKRSRGSNLTEGLCGKFKKPMLWINDPLSFKDQLKLRLWLVRIKPSVLNVAGNRESVNPGIGGSVEICLTRVFHA